MSFLQNLSLAFVHGALSFAAPTLEEPAPVQGPAPAERREAPDSATATRSAATASAAEVARALLIDLTRTARVPGSLAERAAIDLCSRTLTAAGYNVTVDASPLTVAFPTRQALQLFAGPDQKLALQERYETFDWDARPLWPPPPVFRETPAADVRGLVVDAGSGAPDDYARLAAQGVQVTGQVVLVRSNAAPPVLAQEAEQRGARALLVHAPRRTDVEVWPSGPWASERQLAGGAVHAGCKIPVAPIYASEVSAIVARLRARRVRGADGATQTIQVGPGPVEVRIALEVPRREVTTLTLHASRDSEPTTASPHDAALRLEAPLSSFSADALGAAEATLAVLIALDPSAPRALRLQLGGAPHVVNRDESSETAVATMSLAQQFAQQFAFGTDLAGTAADGFLLFERYLDPGCEALARAAAAYIRDLAARR